jgi:DNA-directed RNA polymerase specialized sigma24 family protein
VERHGFRRENVRKAIKSVGLHAGYLWCRPGMEEVTLRLAKRFDIERRLRDCKTKHPDKETLERLYRVENLPAKTIAERYGCTVGTVHQWAWRMGITRPPLPPLTVETLRSLYLDEGLTAAQIAERTGRTKRTIQTYLSRHGIRKKETA